jgi:signal transduction histidine kinase
MADVLHAMPIDSELAMVAARGRARELGAALGFAAHDQTRIATSVLEVARIVLSATAHGRVEFLLDAASRPQALLIRFVAPATTLDHLRGQSTRVARRTEADEPGAAMGILAAQRLMDACRFEDAAGDAVITLTQHVPEPAAGAAGATATAATAVAAAATPSAPGAPRAAAVPASAALAAEAAKAAAPDAQNPFDEVLQQNHELINALDDLRERRDELVRLTRELEDTNRGVVALYAELDERADHLRRADEAKSRFLSNMSHEFRSPLYSIRALSKLLMDRADGELTDEQAKQVRFIRKAAEELSETVDDLLDIAKIEAGKIELRPVEFEVANLFSALRGMLRPLVPASGVELLFDPCDDIPPLYADEGKVSQILRNFISNALKFTEQGEVRVQARYDAARKLLTFSVSDTGIGIAPEHQPRVFEEFEQVENRLQTYVKGTGLGLPLCSKLCKLLGGTVGLRSELGKGSTFTATIQAFVPTENNLP